MENLSRSSTGRWVLMKFSAASLELNLDKSSVRKDDSLDLESHLNLQPWGRHSSPFQPSRLSLLTTLSTMWLTWDGRMDGVAKGCWWRHFAILSTKLSTFGAPIVTLFSCAKSNRLKISFVFYKITFDFLICNAG